MTDPDDLTAALIAAEDAFGHARGEPTFEPGFNSSKSAAPGEVQIQKACRLLELSHRLDDVGAYYGAILEASFIAIEHTLQGYLLALTGIEEHELRDHDRPYSLARGRVPLTEDTLDRLERLYDERRTKHYYGTTVTTEQQARSLRATAITVHDHVVGFDHEVERHCTCSNHL